MLVPSGYGGQARHFALSAEVRQTHARIDETSERIDAPSADMNAQFDRVFALLKGTPQYLGRRQDAIERRLAETAPPSGQDATP